MRLYVQAEIRHNKPAARQYYTHTQPGRSDEQSSIPNRSKQEYVAGDRHTQNVENLWSNIKRGITGVYRHVDPKYLQMYVDEYAFRYSNRKNPPKYMFDLILMNIAK